MEIILQLKLKLNHITGIFLSVFAIAYAPFLIATQYLYPLGIHEWDYISQWYGVIPVDSFWNTQQYMYQNMMGRYSSTAILSTLPFWYSLDSFRLFALIDLLLIPISLWYLLRSLFTSQGALIVSASIMLLYLHQITNLYDSLLRFTCMPIYHFGLIGGCFSLGFLLRYIAGQPYWYLLASILVGGVVIGTNEISMLQYLSSISIILLLHYAKSDAKVSIVVGWLFFLICALLAVSAPGNFNRAQLYEGSMSFFNAFGLSAATSVYLWFRWLSDSLLLPLSILMIVLSKKFQLLEWQFADKRSIKFLLFGLTFLVPASLFPLLYGTGGLSLPERVVDLTFLVMSTMWLITLFTLSRYYHQKNSPRPFGTLQSIITLSLSVFIIFHLFGDGLSLDRQKAPSSNAKIKLIQTESNISTAWLQFIDGTYSDYAKESGEIDLTVKNCKSDTCITPPLQTTDFIGYDPLYDRLHKNGDRKMGKALDNPKVKVVKYQQ